MTRVKICGITRLEDAKAALDAGADAIGVVFAKSSRQVSLSQAAKICRSVGPWIATVGVFVNHSYAFVSKAVRACGLRAVQLHGDETKLFARGIRGVQVIKAIRVENCKSISDTKWPVDAVLFDTAVEGMRGGTAVAFDWNWLKSYQGRAPYILSGGLKPENIAQAVRIARPYGVDVSGGVEKMPGIKDPQKIKEFIRGAKRS